MKKVEAWQHLYLRLEREVSPTGFEGYQTLCYTQPDIPATEIREIEKRLLYFPSQSTPPKKQAFFVSSSGLLVLTNMVRMAESDRHGRECFLAHSILVSPDVLAANRIAPCEVFDAMRFATTVQEALGCVSPQDGLVLTESSRQRRLQEARCGSVTFEMPDASPQEEDVCGRWPIEDLRKLAFLVLRAEKLKKQEMAVAITGPPEAIRDTLRIAHRLIPSSLVSQCSFDDYFLDDHGGPFNLHASYYWAAGFPDVPRDGHYVHVDAVAHTVRKEITWTPANAYEKWLEQQLMLGDWEGLVRKRDNVYALSCYLNGQAPDVKAFDALSDDDLKLVFTADRESVCKQVYRHLEGRIGPLLATRILPELLGFSGDALLRGCWQGFEPSVLMECAYRSYLTSSLQHPGPEECRALAIQQESTPNPRVAALVAFWNQQIPTLRNALIRFSPEEYEKFVQAAFAGLSAEGGALPWEPAGLFIREKADQFMQSYLRFDLAARAPMSILANMMVEQGCTEELERLAPSVVRQSPGEIRALVRIVRNNTSIPPAFKRRVALEAKKQQAARYLWIQYAILAICICVLLGVVAHFHHAWSAIYWAYKSYIWIGLASVVAVCVLGILDAPIVGSLFRYLLSFFQE